MCTITLFDAALARPAGFTACVNLRLQALGARASGRMDGDALVLTIEGAPERADEIATLVVDGWRAWRKTAGSTADAAANTANAATNTAAPTSLLLTALFTAWRRFTRRDERGSGVSRPTGWTPARARWPVSKVTF